VTTVLGPAWADTSGRAQTVLNPLRVQNHVTRMAGTFVPGVIATTTLARYYGMHPWLATIAAEQNLNRDNFVALVRRAEVALAWASGHHREHLSELPVAHGYDELHRFTSAGILDVEAASQPRGYMQNERGFFGSTYGNSEIELGLLTADWKPGPRFDARAHAAMTEALAPLIEIAGQDSLTIGDAEAAADGGLCVCAARIGAEGEWLRDLVWGRLGGDRWAPLDEARRETATVLANVIVDATEPVKDPVGAMRTALVYSGPLAAIPAAIGHDIAAAWQGLFLRHLAVTAWRELWTSVVNECAGTTAAEIGAIVASNFDDVTVGDFCSALITAEGDRLLPAEADAWERYRRPVSSVAVLAVVSQRVTQLDGVALDVLCGDDDGELGPRWVAAQLEAGADYRLRTWVAQVVVRLLERSQRVALEKFRLDDQGRGVVPAQVRERDGRWHQVARTGDSPLNLRLVTLADVLAGCGLFDHTNGIWTVSETGREFLGR
jgi:hypothetical protein